MDYAACRDRTSEQRVVTHPSEVFTRRRTTCPVPSDTVHPGYHRIAWISAIVFLLIELEVRLGLRSIESVDVDRLLAGRAKAFRTWSIVHECSQKKLYEQYILFHVGAALSNRTIDRPNAIDSGPSTLDDQKSSHFTPLLGAGLDSQSPIQKGNQSGTSFRKTGVHIWRAVSCRLEPVIDFSARFFEDFDSALPPLCVFGRRTTENTEKSRSKVNNRL